MLDAVTLPPPLMGRNLAGFAVKLTESHIVIGGPIAGEDRFGRVWVYSRATGILEHVLAASDATIATGFGVSIDADDQHVLVGAPFGTEAPARGGAAYLFDINTGTELAKFQRDTPEVGDEFGWDLRLAGDSAFIAAPFVEVGEARSVGAVFKIDLLTGNTLERLDPVRPDASTRFGESIDLDGDLLIVAADNAGTPSVTIIDRQTGADRLVLRPDAADPTDRFGTDAVIEGTTVVVSAPGDVVDLDDVDAFVIAFLAGCP